MRHYNFAFILCLLLFVGTCLAMNKIRLRASTSMLRIPAQGRIMTLLRSKQSSNKEDADNVSELERALRNARSNIASSSSPGAGLGSADDQSDAAYADLINTTMEQRGISLSEEDKMNLERGGTMWEQNAKAQTNKWGLIGDFFSVLKAFSGGAHIEKNKYGET